MHQHCDFLCTIPFLYKPRLVEASFKIAVWWLVRCSDPHCTLKFRKPD
jgi:hypothetical protein